MSAQSPKIIILPGWGGSKETWKDFIKIMGSNFSVKCLNLPCFGDEPCPSNVWGVEEYSKFVRAKIQNENEKVVLLGHSFGGQVAAYLAASNPELIDKLILVAPALFRPNNFVRRIAFAIIAKCGKILFKIPFLEKFSVMARKILYRSANSPDYASTSGIKRDIFKKVIREDLTQILPKISVPTLLIWGKRDSYTPFSGARKALSLIKNSKLKIFENGTHGLHLQDPENLYSAIKDFIFDV